MFPKMFPSSQTQTQSTQDSQSRTDIFSHRKCFSQNDESPTDRLRRRWATRPSLFNRQSSMNEIVAEQKFQDKQDCGVENIKISIIDSLQEKMNNLAREMDVMFSKTGLTLRDDITSFLRDERDKNSQLESMQRSMQEKTLHDVVLHVEKINNKNADSLGVVATNHQETMQTLKETNNSLKAISITFDEIKHKLDERLSTISESINDLQQKIMKCEKRDDSQVTLKQLKKESDVHTDTFVKQLAAQFDETFMKEYFSKIEQQFVAKLDEFQHRQNLITIQPIESSQSRMNPGSNLHDNVETVASPTTSHQAPKRPKRGRKVAMLKSPQKRKMVPANTTKRRGQGNLASKRPRRVAANRKKEPSPCKTDTSGNRSTVTRRKVTKLTHQKPVCENRPQPMSSNSWMKHGLFAQSPAKLSETPDCISVQSSPALSIDVDDIFKSTNSSFAQV